jgi:adenosylcobyric acid synthase
MVMDLGDAAMIRGFLINKFRGDPALFEDGYRAIEERSGWRGFGVVPWLAATARLPSEDAVVLERAASRGEGRKLIACPILPRISNFDDLDPLKLEPGVALVMVPPGQPIPGDAALVVLPGSKATIADLGFVRAQGWDVDILSHHRRGGAVLGLCGGYQMLGRSVADPLGIEGPASRVEGLGLLDVETSLAPAKVLRQACGTALGAPVAGYEMHMGETGGPDTARPFALLDGSGPDGAISHDGSVMGTYLHGLLALPEARAALLARIGVTGSGRDYAGDVDAALDEIAAELERHVDVEALLRLSKEAAA